MHNRKMEKRFYTSYFISNNELLEGRQDTVKDEIKPKSGETGEE